MTLLLQKFLTTTSLINQELEKTENEAHLSSTIGTSDPIDIAIKEYQKHPSINKIKGNWVPSEPFTFSNITVLEVLHQLEILNAKKASPIGSIPAKILKDNSIMFAATLQNCFNNNMDKCNFPS